MVTVPGGPVPASVGLEAAAAYVLGKQGLAGALGAGSGPPDVLAAVGAAAGIYSTAPTCYLSCAARVGGFRPAQLDVAVRSERSLTLLRCMRGSAYAVPRESLPFVVAATGAWIRNVTMRLVQGTGLDAATYAALADRIDAALTGRPPATVPEIRGLLGDAAPGGREALPRAVAMMAAEARLVRAQRRGGWRSDSYGYARWVDWFGAPLAQLAPEAGRVQLARWYLQAFGPATPADLKWWSGWSRRDTTAALTALGDEVAAIALTSDDGPVADALCLASELSSVLSTDAGMRRGVRLLPVWDSYLMGYADRRRLVRDADRPWVYDRSGNATSVVLVDGVVAGLWEHEGDPGGVLTIRVAPLAPANRRWWTAIEQVAADVAAAVGAAELRVQRAAKPSPLADGARNAFLAPIRLGAPAS